MGVGGEGFGGGRSGQGKREKKWLWESIFVERWKKCLWLKYCWFESIITRLKGPGDFFQAFQNPLSIHFSISFILRDFRNVSKNKCYILGEGGTTLPPFLSSVLSMRFWKKYLGWYRAHNIKCWALAFHFHEVDLEPTI